MVLKDPTLSLYIFQLIIGKDKLNCEDTTKVVIRYHLWSKLYLEEAVFKENFARVREEQPLILSLIHAADCCFAVLSLHHQSSAQASGRGSCPAARYPLPPRCSVSQSSPTPIPCISLSLSATHTPFTMQAKAYMEICNARRP